MFFFISCPGYLSHPFEFLGNVDAKSLKIGRDADNPEINLELVA
jgi:hypothetical protein